MVYKTEKLTSFLKIDKKTSDVPLHGKVYNFGVISIHYIMMSLLLTDLHFIYFGKLSTFIIYT